MDFCAFFFRMGIAVSIQPVRNTDIERSAGLGSGAEGSWQRTVLFAVTLGPKGV